MNSLIFIVIVAVMIGVTLYESFRAIDKAIKEAEEMIYKLEDIKRDWENLSSTFGAFEDYLHKQYVAVYDHACNFVGYRRRGDHEDCHGGICS